jgi:hypothetical protein
MEFLDVFFKDFKVYKCFALFIRQVLPIITNTTQALIHKFMEKGNSQQSNNNLKIYKMCKQQCSHIRHPYKMSVIRFLGNV